MGASGFSAVATGLRRTARWHDVDGWETAVAYAASMRKFVVLLALSLASIAGCAHGPYESVLEDGGFRLSLREFNVGSSGTDECPGELLGHASQDSAYCGTAPQRCQISPAPGGRPILCQCNASPAGGRALWSCR